MAEHPSKANILDGYPVAAPSRARMPSGRLLAICSTPPFRVSRHATLTILEMELFAERRARRNHLSLLLRRGSGGIPQLGLAA